MEQQADEGEDMQARHRKRDAQANERSTTHRPTSAAGGRKDDTALGRGELDDRQPDAMGRRIRRGRFALDGSDFALCKWVWFHELGHMMIADHEPDDWSENAADSYRDELLPQITN